jgi:hypothetical protein
MKVLLIDDIREFGKQLPALAPTDSFAVARDFQAGIDFLLAHSRDGWDILYLDHDLGDPDPAHTGYAIMSLIEEFPHLKPGKIVLVTSNPVGRKQMQTVIDKLYPKETV